MVALHTNTAAFPIPAVATVLNIVRDVFGTVRSQEPAGA
jgi:hypothetical protein